MLTRVAQGEWVARFSLHVFPYVGAYLLLVSRTPASSNFEQLPPPLSLYRLYGFKIHPMAYQLQQQAAAKSRSTTSRQRSQKQNFK